MEEDKIRINNVQLEEEIIDLIHIFVDDIGMNLDDFWDCLQDIFFKYGYRIGVWKE